MPKFEAYPLASKPVDEQTIRLAVTTNYRGNAILCAVNVRGEVLACGCLMEILPDGRLCQATGVNPELGLQLDSCGRVIIKVAPEPAATSALGLLRQVVAHADADVDCTKLINVIRSFLKRTPEPESQPVPDPEAVALLRRAWNVLDGLTGLSTPLLGEIKAYLDVLLGESPESIRDTMRAMAGKTPEPDPKPGTEPKLDPNHAKVAADLATAVDLLKRFHTVYGHGSSSSAAFCATISEFLGRVEK